MGIVLAGHHWAQGLAPLYVLDCAGRPAAFVHAYGRLVLISPKKSKALKSGRGPPKMYGSLGNFLSRLAAACGSNRHPRRIVRMNYKLFSSLFHYSRSVILCAPSVLRGIKWVR